MCSLLSDTDFGAIFIWPDLHASPQTQQKGGGEQECAMKRVVVSEAEGRAAGWAKSTAHSYLISLLIPPLRHSNSQKRD